MFSSRKSHFNLYYFQVIFSEKFKNYQSFERKDIVLLLGTTGAGKSTFANYMAGSQMENEFDDSVCETYIKPKLGFKEICKIGHTVKSETIYPQGIDSGKGFDYVDNCGFDYNSFVETKVFGTVLTQLAIQQSNHVRGIVAFIRSPNACSSGETFYGYFSGLEKVIDLLKNQQSILFIITNTSKKYQQKYFYHLVERFAAAEEKGIYRGNTARNVLSMISPDSNNVFVFDPLNESHREIIQSKVAELKSIPKTEFSFPKIDKDHEAFEKNILSISTKVSETMKLNKDDLAFIHQVAKMANFHVPIINQFVEIYEKNKEKEEKEMQSQIIPLSNNSGSRAEIR